MKPAPFTKSEASAANKTAYVVKADPDAKTTAILEKKSKKSVWQMSEYIGRKIPYVSPDGKTLVAYGNFYYGDIINLNPKDEIIVVYSSGKEIKRLTYNDVSGKVTADEADKRKIPVMSGGWIGLSDLITKLDVDFKTDSLVFTLHDKSVKTISF